MPNLEMLRTAMSTPRVAVGLLLLLLGACSAVGVLPCEVHPTCEACTKDPPCGWCSGKHLRIVDNALVPVAVAHCTEGTAEGPLSNYCEAFEFTGCPEPSGGPCGRHKSCGPCVAAETCGWCEDTQSCTASCGTCAMYHPDFCPGPWNCSKHTQAYNCLRSPHCGYCAETQRCEASRGACAHWHTIEHESPLNLPKPTTTPEPSTGPQ